MLSKSIFFLLFLVLLEVCDSEKMSSAVATEQELNDVNNEFEEDFTLMTGQSNKNKVDDYDNQDVSDEEQMNSGSEEQEEESDYVDDQDEYESDSESSDDEKLETKPVENEKKISKKLYLNKNNVPEDNSATKTKKRKGSIDSTIKNKKTKLTDGDYISTDDEHDSFDEDEGSEFDSEHESKNKDAPEMNEEGTWEDIYGRLRTKDGTVISVSSETEMYF